MLDNLLGGVDCVPPLNHVWFFWFENLKFCHEKKKTKNFTFHWILFFLDRDPCNASWNNPTIIVQYHPYTLNNNHGAPFFIAQVALTEKYSSAPRNHPNSPQNKCSPLRYRMVPHNANSYPHVRLNVDHPPRFCAVRWRWMWRDILFGGQNILEYRELTYRLPRHFWRWVSFSQGGIC